MTKLIPYFKNEEFTGLVDELFAGIVEFQQVAGEMLIKFKFFLGSTIIQHPAYQKFGKGNSEFIGKLSARLDRELGGKAAKRISRSSLYDAIQVVSAYPTEKKLLDALEKQGEGLYWSVALRLVGRSVQELETTEECNHSCPRHCKTLNS